MPSFHRRTARVRHGAGSSEPPDPYARGLALLARREWSVRAIRERLLLEGCDAARVESSIERLLANGALDDARVARAVAHTAAHVKHRGPLRVLRELAAMGIDDDIAQAALDEVLPRDDAAVELEREIARRLKRPVDEHQVRRAFAALVRLGFAPGDVGRALRRHARGASADGEDLG